jgi:hypothetical protein
MLLKALIERRMMKCRLRCIKSRVSFLLIVLSVVMLQAIIHLHVYSHRLDDPKDETAAVSPPTESSQDTVSPLDIYDASRHPVLVLSEGLVLTTPSRIKVGIVTVLPLAGETMHFMYDGVMGSEYLELVGVINLRGNNETESTNTTTTTTTATPELKPSDAAVWIVDGNRAAKLKRSFLDTLIQSPSPTWKVLIIDFSDRFQFQLRRYHRLQIWDKSHVRIAVRSIVQGRHYLEAQDNRMVSGRIAPNLQTAGGPMLHCPYAVRTDIVESLTSVLSKAAAAAAADKDQIWKRPRPLDVFHPWNVSSREGKSKFRNAVSKTVRSWNNATTVNSSSRILITSIEEQGPRRTVGRNAANQEYVQAMLSAKIVVVTQKDDWEDHYRLMEALISGPLVLADTMLAAPHGLEHGKNVIFFSTLDELQDRAMYYLVHEQERQEIAKRGWELAMGRHRSWHRMEELLFGRPLTGFNYNVITGNE